MSEDKGDRRYEAKEEDTDVPGLRCVVIKNYSNECLRVEATAYQLATGKMIVTSAPLTKEGGKYFLGVIDKLRVLNERGKFIGEH